MVRRFWSSTALVVVILALAVAAFPTTAPSQSLEDILFQAFEITADIRPVPLQVTCTDQCRIVRFGTMKAKTLVQFKVNSPSPVSQARVFLDSDLNAKAVTGVPLTFRRERENLVLTFNPPLQPDATGSLTFEYEGQPFLLFDDLILLDDGVLYPVLVSPFGDISANRGTLKTTVTVPAGYLLASTGKMTRSETGGMQTYRWEVGEPLPYIAVVGGRVYRSIEKQAGQIGLTVLVRPQYDAFADKIADFTGKTAEYYSRLLYPFPFDRMTVVSAPFGRALLGLGFPALMMLTEDAFTGGQSGDLRRDSYLFLLVAHEAAHTYFPAQTSGRGIAYVWLSEGFAEYLGLMTVQAVMGQAAFRKELDEDRKWYASVAGRGELPIGAYTRLNSGGATAVAVRYAKGAFVLHMLRFLVGDDAFQKILQTYATRFRGQSVRVDDFAQVASEVAGRDLSDFFRQWINERVLPDYTIAEATSAAAEGGFRTTVKVRNAGTGAMPVEVLFEQEGGEKVIKRVDIGGGVTIEVSEITPRRVTKVEADPEKWLLQSNYTNDAAAVR